MSDQFQHVMVLISIIIGLGITNLLLGLSGAIERLTESTRPLRISWATIFWLAYLFFLMVLFWWWEFRLLELLKQWSLWNYFLVICFAVVLFLQVALLIPRDWDNVDDMNEYFLAKRRWFYSVFALSLIIDLIDSYVKGGLAYIKGAGILSWGFNLAGLLAAIVGFRSTRIRTHSTMATLFLVWEVIIGFDVSPLLHVRPS
ncbi:MAG TPA: hypothetical protein VMA33_02240 [Candidatus Tectomicrobia bacterium]|nr:hypothetical protein [Candidatus Tectomicrobia bacterium]